MSFYTIALLLLVSVIVVAALPFNNQNNDQPNSNFNNMMKKFLISMMISTSENDQANVSGVAKLGIATGSEGVEGVGGTGTVEDHDSEELKSLAPTTEEPSTMCLLSSDQLQDIQSTDPSLFYMVVDNRVVTDQSLFELYVRLVGIVSEAATTNHHITDIWLSRAPCKPCMEILDYAFAGANIKPTIHIESWKTTNHQVTTYGTVLQSMGCLSKLKSLGYKLLPWDWESFHEENKSTSCNHYTNNLQLNYVYAAEKETLKKSLPFITGFDEFCQLP